jgi:tetratricopeptide (TPR) repeat protein
MVPACLACALALQWNWSEAEKNFQQAIDLGEHADTLRQYALFLAALGRFDSSWNYLQKARRIDPFSLRQKAVYIKVCHLSREYNKGLETAPEYGPLSLEHEIYRAFLLIQLNRLDEATQIARDLPRKAGADPSLMSAVAEIQAMCGQTVAAGRIAGDFDLLSANSPISKFRQALLRLALGDPDGAIALLSAETKRS